MKLLLVLLALNATISSDLSHLRDLLAVSHIDESANKELLELTETVVMETDPVRYAYHAAAVMTMANHFVWPTTKLEFFNSGKKELERVVEYKPSEVEIRFVRFCVQQGSPEFLGYRNNLSEDKNYILLNIDDTRWTAEYKQEVIEYLNRN